MGRKLIAELRIGEGAAVAVRARQDAVTAREIDEAHALILPDARTLGRSLAGCAKARQHGHVNRDRTAQVGCGRSAIVQRRRERPGAAAGGESESDESPHSLSIRP
jgi:hypothetical protein